MNEMGLAVFSSASCERKQYVWMFGNDVFLSFLPNCLSRRFASMFTLDEFQAILIFQEYMFLLAGKDMQGMGNLQSWWLQMNYYV